MSQPSGVLLKQKYRIIQQRSTFTSAIAQFSLMWFISRRGPLFHKFKTIKHCFPIHILVNTNTSRQVYRNFKIVNMDSSLDNCLNSVFVFKPRLIIGKTRAEEELGQLGRNLDFFLDGLPYPTQHDLPPSPSTPDAASWTRVVWQQQRWRHGKRREQEQQGQGQR